MFCANVEGFNDCRYLDFASDNFVFINNVYHNFFNYYRAI